MTDELFERARAAAIAEVAGVKLFRAGRRLRGECPLCGASKGKRADGAFSADPAAGVFKCFACNAGGDVIELERRLRGGSPREAAERLVGGVLPAPKPWSPRAPEKRAMAPATVRQAWRESQAAAGSPAASYLAARGIVGRPLAEAVKRLRFHPAMLWAWDGDPSLRVWSPAMLAAVHGPPAGVGPHPLGQAAESPLPKGEGLGDPTGGFHATYLVRRGAGLWTKTPMSPAKRMWGPQSDLDGLRGAVWLSDPDGPGPLLVGEGIESTLSAAMLLERPCRMVATLSLGALQGGWLGDRWGRIDPACVSADPERAPFTLPAPDVNAALRPLRPASPATSPVVCATGEEGEVIIAVDRDMSPIKAKVRRAGGGTCEREISGEERARICGALAEQAWRRAGWPRVSVIAPAMGRDFNDELLARRAT